MNAAISLHPDADLIRKFGLGLLDPAEAAEVEEHVENCSECCVLLQNQKDDPFVVQVREATSEAGEPNGGGGSAPEPVSQGDPTVRNEAEIPAGFENHPRYRIVRRIGGGGMGDVYLADDHVIGRPVAIKVIKPEFIGRADLIARFRREIKAAGRLKHNNIVIVYDANVEEAGGVHFFAMEYVEGKNLTQLIKECRQLALARACDYAGQVAKGLQHATRFSIVHRDIKPGNLILSSEGDIKILDFGLAKFVREMDSHLNQEVGSQREWTTESEMLLGTYIYMAPEQADDPRTADIRADIYSLGCTLYHMLAGTAPFPGGSVAQVIKDHANRPPDPIREKRPDIPLEFQAVLDRMLAKNPADRFQTPDEVARALAPFARENVEADTLTWKEKLAQGRAETPVAPSATEVAAKTGWRHFANVRRRTLVAGTVLAIVLCLLAIVLGKSAWQRRTGTLESALSDTARENWRRGKSQMDRRDKEGLNKAIQYFQKVIDEEPSFAPAHAGKADCYNLLADYGWRKPTQAFPRAKEAALEALKWDERCAEAHAALAFVLYSFELKWSEAEAEFHEAIRLDPHYSPARHWYAWYLAQRQRFDESRNQMQAALEQDPNSRIIQTNLGKIDYYHGRYREAIERYQEVLENSKNYPKALMDLALAYEQEKEYGLARAELQKLEPQALSDVGVMAALARLDAASNKRADAQSKLDELLKRRKDPSRFVSAYEIATVYLALGETQHALDMLEEAWHEHDAWIPYLLIDPRLKSLRGHVKYVDLLRRSGLDETQPH